VPGERASVYAFLDVMANHERFTDHMLREWACAGPATGVGARARVINVLGGRRVPVEIEVIDAVDGERTTERNVSAGGRRVGHGTYELADRERGGTCVTFTYAWQKAPLEDRLLSIVIRPMMRRALQQALERLASELEQSSATVTAPAASTAADVPRKTISRAAIPLPSPER
jgi:hypothetical protein